MNEKHEAETAQSGGITAETSPVALAHSAFATAPALAENLAPEAVCPKCRKPWSAHTFRPYAGPAAPVEPYVPGSNCGARGVRDVCPQNAENAAPHRLLPGGDRCLCGWKASALLSHDQAVKAGEAHFHSAIEPDAEKAVPKKSEGNSRESEGNTEPGDLVADALARHWTLEIRCHHDDQQDEAFCACGWFSGRKCNVGEAARAWAKHALEQLPAPAISLPPVTVEAREEENAAHRPTVHPNRKTIITHEQARASLQRFINRHFNNRGEKSRASIPAHHDDDDILLSDYITQGEMNFREAAALVEVQRLTALINTPEILDFTKAVQIEAAHQRERWDPDHDAQKQDEDWFWTLGYLAGKALRAQRDGDGKKHLHHLISSSALLCNWHAVALREARRENGNQNETAIS